MADDETIIVTDPGDMSGYRLKFMFSHKIVREDPFEIVFYGAPYSTVPIRLFGLLGALFGAAFRKANMRHTTVKLQPATREKPEETLNLFRLYLDGAKNSFSQGIGDPTDVCFDAERLGKVLADLDKNSEALEQYAGALALNEAAATSYDTSALRGRIEAIEKTLGEQDVNRIRQSAHDRMKSLYQKWLSNEKYSAIRQAAKGKKARPIEPATVRSAEPYKEARVIAAPAASGERRSPASLGQLLFSFDGEIDRTEFWKGVAAIAIFGGVAAWLADALGTEYDPNMWIGGPAWPIGAWMFTAVGAKRCRDRGKPGWVMIFAFVPLIGVIWYVVELGMLAHRDAADGPFLTPTGWMLVGVLGLLVSIIAIFLGKARDPHLGPEMGFAVVAGFTAIFFLFIARSRFRALRRS